MITAWHFPALLPTWTASGASSTPDIKAILMNVDSYLITAQVGVLGVISIAVGLVALIAQRESSSTDVQVYYHESLAFEVVASSVALLAVLCAQLLWPAQFLLHRLGGGTDLQVFKLLLLALHTSWLLLNLCGLAHFVATTFRFVQQSEREVMRERYTANFVQPLEMTVRLREHLYQAASLEFLNRPESDGNNVDTPTLILGFDSDDLGLAEIQTVFANPMVIRDVRMIWLRWVVRRWAARCDAEARSSAARRRGLGLDSPLLVFSVQLDRPLHGEVIWCRRRAGAPLTRTERLVLRCAFLFKRARHERNLPSPDEILEELADKAALQIDRLAPVAFGSALREMTRYHKFLLALNASRSLDGELFSYAEVRGDAFRAPHQLWIRQYARLFERATDRIPDDASFIRTLAHLPMMLLPGSTEPEPSDAVIRAILDLGPLLVHRLEAWVTKRTSIDNVPGEAPSSRLALAGSDAKAYANVLTEIAGAWEALLQSGPIVSRRRQRSEAGDAASWAVCRASWPFLLQHLQNTAYSLAVAVWNEDEAGTSLFRDVLVRWRETLNPGFDSSTDLRHRRLLFPTLLTFDWSSAAAQVAARLDDYTPSPGAGQVFGAILSESYNDTLLLTAALLLFWTINQKQISNIGARTAAELLRRELSGSDNEGHHSSQSSARSFRSLFLDMVRLELAGDRFRDDTYGTELDRFLASLDNMTERRTVPGRIFTPSTLHGREDLLVSVVAILLAAAPLNGDDGVGNRVSELAEREDILPEGDRSLRNVAFALGRYAEILGQPCPLLKRGFELLKSDGDFTRATQTLQTILAAALATIGVERSKRLKARPIDAKRMEKLRSAFETTILTQSLTQKF